MISITDEKVSSIETSAYLQQKLSFSVHGNVVLRHWALLRIVVVTSFCRLRRLFARFEWSIELALWMQLLINLHIATLFVQCREFAVIVVHSLNVLSVFHLLMISLVYPYIITNDVSQAVPLGRVKGKHLREKSLETWWNLALEVHLRGHWTIIIEDFLVLGSWVAEIRQ